MRPILICQTHPTEPSRHTFEREEVRKGAASPSHLGQAQIYRCDDCGTERVFGFNQLENGHGEVLQ